MGNFPHPKIQTRPTPRLADVQCCRLQFQPGDRVVVRIYQKLDQSQQRRLKKSVEKWAGDVEVLIVDCTVFDVKVLKPGDV